MSAGAAGIWTAVGLVFVIGGIWCGVVAYRDTLKEHDTLPIWPWADRQVHRLRSWWPFARQPARSVPRAVSVSGGAAAQAYVTGSATVIRADETVDQRIARLESRIENAERQAASDRNRSENAEKRISERLEAQAQRLDKADEQLRELARSVAVSTARLQISGLVSVGFGTVVMAMPTLIAAF